MIPVVNYERMNRLKADPLINVPMNMNTVSVVIIIFGILYMYRRYMIIKNGHSQSRI